MDTKKSPRADLENKKGLFTEIGLVVALVACFMVFEWSTTAAEINIKGMSAPIDFDDPEMVPVTRTPEPPTPAPPPLPKLADVIAIVEDDTDMDNELDAFNTEAEPDAVVDLTPIDVPDEVTDDINDIFIVVEQMPTFPGGDLELRKFLAQSVKYPAIAIDNGVQGRVFVSFVIDQQGDVTDVRVARPLDPNLDKEAVRVVKSMPRWTPGFQRGRAVRVSYTVPINFVLQH
ncbi:MAG: energy transducer TonB [Bacteroidales bacterium]|nr:energy transducer TonB [Bacteroidales bacterium]